MGGGGRGPWVGGVLVLQREVGFTGASNCVSGQYKLDKSSVGQFLLQTAGFFFCLGSAKRRRNHIE